MFYPQLHTSEGERKERSYYIDPSWGPVTSWVQQRGRCDCGWYNIARLRSLRRRTHRAADNELTYSRLRINNPGGASQRAAHEDPQPPPFSANQNL
ncbi:hypothetical protein SK128_015204 [Halocaridina rubra]|uniref:Uncharacterized protein n=1 Tax=Halocaridina rubra TaxID=373956 RepID=A0AAN8XNM7_HALRR